jgi:hypothetical protein
MNRTAGQVQARSERFMVGLSGAGKPMLRTLPEMDPGDVMDAVAFSAGAVWRARKAAGQHFRGNPRFRKALARHVMLLDLIQELMPQWDRRGGAVLRKVLARHRRGQTSAA